MKRALTLGLVLLATAVNASDLGNTHEAHRAPRARILAREPGPKNAVGPLRKFFSTARTRSFPRGNQKQLASLRACAR